MGVGTRTERSGASRDPGMLRHAQPSAGGSPARPVAGRMINATASTMAGQSHIPGYQPPIPRGRRWEELHSGPSRRIFLAASALSGEQPGRLAQRINLPSRWQRPATESLWRRSRAALFHHAIFCAIWPVQTEWRRGPHGISGRLPCRKKRRTVWPREGQRFVFQADVSNGFQGWLTCNSSAKHGGVGELQHLGRDCRVPAMSCRSFQRGVGRPGVPRRPWK